MIVFQSEQNIGIFFLKIDIYNILLRTPKNFVSTKNTTNTKNGINIKNNVK